MSSEANGGPRPAEVARAAAEGEAALFLVEALMLALAERGMIDAGTLLDAVETALDAKLRGGAEGDEGPLSREAVGVLARVEATLLALARGPRGG